MSLEEYEDLMARSRLLSYLIYLGVEDFSIYHEALELVAYDE